MLVNERFWYVLQPLQVGVAASHELDVRVLRSDRDSQQIFVAQSSNCRDIGKRWHWPWPPMDFVRLSKVYQKKVATTYHNSAGSKICHNISSVILLTLQDHPLNQCCWLKRLTVPETYASPRWTRPGVNEWQPFPWPWDSSSSRR